MRGAMRPHYTPKLKKRTALTPELKEVFRRHRSQPIERVISLINPMLRGWVNYFAVGHSSECFSLIKDWVEKKVRRHMAQAQRRQGFGWERWSRRWLYDTLKLFNGYRVRHGGPKSRPSRVGHIGLGAKRMGARSAGNPHAACDAEGAGNVARSEITRPSRRASPRPY
jgi:RNA-directed DNA polymerase